MKRRGLLLLSLTILGSTITPAICERSYRLCAQEGVVSRPYAASNSHLGGANLGTIDAQTRWAFRTLSPVSISSPIVRLGDVVRPLNPNMAGWQRLRRSPIGLLPLGAQPMTIQRSRLERAILDAEATPLAVDWIGPAEILVAYQEPSPDTVDARSDQRLQAADHSIGNAAIVQVSHSDDPRGDPSQGAVSKQDGTSTVVKAADANRIMQWVMLAVDRSYPELAKEFRVEVPDQQTELSSLVGIAGVNDIAAIGEIAEGICRFQLRARSTSGPVDAELRLNLISHPKVAAPRRVLPKGHRISSLDLEMVPIPEEQLDVEHVRDPADVVGMEVHGYVRPGQPVKRSDLGSPTLVRRGDLIEVRVLGGGITVTTNAKAQGDGAAADLIEVETLQPRKRLLARVVQPGLVEIVTRAPRVQP